MLLRAAIAEGMKWASGASAGWRQPEGGVEQVRLGLSDEGGFLHH